LSQNLRQELDQSWARKDKDVHQEKVMSYEKRADYEAQWLFPPSLEDLLGKEHAARFIREMVDALKLEELGFRQRVAEEGRPNYASDLLLKVWLYGYFHKIRATRGLERACMDQIGLLWLTGLRTPDHNTLWRFWRDNRTAIRKVLKAALEVAAKAELVGLVLHAVDGTKIETAAAKRGAWHREDVEKLLANIDNVIEDVMKDTESAEAENGVEYRLPEQLHDRQELQGMIQERLREMDQQSRDQVMPPDADSRMMKLADGRKRFGYNAQVVVDEKSGLIVAQDVVQDESDNYQLTPMLEQVADNLGQVADETVGDGGYKAPSELARAEQRHHPVLVNLGKPTDGDEDYSAARFVYNEADDHGVCPRGEILPFWRKKSKDRAHATTVRIYRCRSYADCPARWQCSNSKNGRTIEIGPHHQAVLRQRIKQQDPAKSALLKKRGQIVERIFGWIKQDLEFRRWTVRGLDNVRTQWALICTAVNLRVIYQHWLKGRLPLTAQIVN
jgi:transposase